MTVATLQPGREAPMAAARADYWNDVARHGGLRPVLDPNDVMGMKNEALDRRQQAALTRFFRRLRLTNCRAVLDFGCGIGRHHGLLCSIARRYVGVDRAPAMLERAPGETHLIEGLELPFEDGAFDLIFCFWVLQHIVEDDALRRTLREFRRCLEPRGHVVIVERSAPEPAEPGMPDGYIRRRPVPAYVEHFRAAGFRLRCIRKLTYRFRWRELLSRRLIEGEHLYAFTAA